jgi:hypothetical protein
MNMAPSPRGPTRPRARGHCRRVRLGVIHRPSLACVGRSAPYGNGCTSANVRPRPRQKAARPGHNRGMWTMPLGFADIWLRESTGATASLHPASHSTSFDDMATTVLRVRLIGGDRMDITYDEPDVSDEDELVEHVISTLAQDSGVLRAKHGDRLVVLYGRGVAAIEIAPRGAVL